jgi:hypothetical protein
MRRTTTRCAIAALAALGLFSAGCGNDQPGSTTGTAVEAKPTAAPADTSSGKTAAPASATAAVLPPPAPATAVAAGASAAPSAQAVAAPSSSAAAAAATGSSRAAAGPKTFDCGAKGQKPCPMQGWMKGVMAGASSSGDAAKLGSALAYVASRPPPGFGNWVSIANAGVAKAKAGDIDGAKTSCKQCHDAYKETYKTTMRDRPF